MTPERWKQIDDLAQSALERGPDERAGFLDEACAADEELRREVEAQIAYQQQASKFLEEPAFKQHLGTQASLPALLIADSRTETESMEGRAISHYTILRKLGAGGMGEVYLALDTTLSRKVAIKFLSQSSVAGEQAKKRLVREAKAAAALDHPHICAVYEVGEEGGYSFIVMQYVEGETLANRIQRQPIEVREVLEIAVQIADGLAEAHSHRIIHRDIKPQNVMRTSSGQVKVLDFGLARVVREGSLIDSLEETESLLTMPGSVIGTVPYMSPEQVRGEALDGRSDIFSFGAVLYEMLSGRQPFQGESVGATMSSILTKEPAPLARYASDVPDELQRIVGKALSKDKEGRYQGIKDLLIDLQELKQELEFESKLERSIERVVRDRSTTPERPEGERRAEAGTSPQQTGHTDESFTTPTTSGTRAVNGEIRRHKVGVSLTLASIAIAAVAGYLYFHREPILTDKDTILLVDFDNKTGDTIFDGALKQGLAIQLSQSPFLSLFSDAHVRETLRLMNRPPDERVTPEIGREICERQGLKAFIAGSLAPLGSHYVLTLEAVNGHNGDITQREQVEAESKEQVLKALSQAASKLREKLGESLSSLQRFNTPLQVTTSSLEAFKAYSLGFEQMSRSKYFEAIPFMQRAVDLDPNFANAYSGLSVCYVVVRRPALACEFAKRAFALRDRVDERRKLSISSVYYAYGIRKTDKAIDHLELLISTYPNDSYISTSHNNLAGHYASLGQYEKSVAEATESLRINPSIGGSYSILGSALVSLNRLSEAKEIFERARRQGLDASYDRAALYAMAFVSEDLTVMQQQLDWMRGRKDEYLALAWQSRAAAFSGHWRQAESFSQRAIDLARHTDAKESAARYASEQALIAAMLGRCTQAKTAAAEARALEQDQLVDGSIYANLSLALTLCGEASEASEAKRLLDEYTRQFPEDTLFNNLWLPTARAAQELQHDNGAQAVDALQIAGRYEPAGFFWPQYLRGHAYLKLDRAAEAAVEFRKILEHRGEAPLSPLYPLAHLGLARAAMLQGDTTKARKSYQDFLALWKDADADLPILIEAKKEYEKVK